MIKNETNFVERPFFKYIFLPFNQTDHQPYHNKYFSVTPHKNLRLLELLEGIRVQIVSTVVKNKDFSLQQSLGSEIYSQFPFSTRKS